MPWWGYLLSAWAIVGVALFFVFRYSVQDVPDDLNLEWQPEPRKIKSKGRRLGWAGTQ